MIRKTKAEWLGRRSGTHQMTDPIGIVPMRTLHRVGNGNLIRD